MGQVYQCWWMICREINIFFPGSSITSFTFYIHLWPIYWLSIISLRLIFLVHTRKSTTWSTSGFPPKMLHSWFPHACCAPIPYLHPWFDYLTDIWYLVWTGLVFQLLGKYFVVRLNSPGEVLLLCEPLYAISCIGNLKKETSSLNVFEFLIGV
jgi:hypothetical protein